MDRPLTNIARLALASMLEALQLIIIIALIFSFIPIPYDDFYYTFFPFMQKGLQQKRDVLFYDIFIIGAVVLQAGSLFVLRKALHEGRAVSKLNSWTVMSLLLLVPQFFLIYQVWLGPNPQLARQALSVLCALAVAARVFWVEVYAWAHGFTRRRSIAFKFPNRKTLEAVWRRRRSAGVLVLLSWAWCIQAYLCAFAAYGWAFHRPVWPSSDPWNYQVLAVLCLAVSIGAVAVHRNRRTLTGFVGRWAVRAVVEGLLAFFLLNALFKLHVYDYQPQLAQRAYTVFLVLAFFVKIGWPWIEGWIKTVCGLLINDRHQPALKTACNAAFIVFIVLFLYVPDMEAAIARMYMGEQMHSADATLMNTGWAYHSGCKLNVDVNNRYGLGWAVMVSKLADLMGGFTYLNVYTIVMWACIVYFIAAYGLLRSWLNSVPLAMAGILIALKTQTFREETASMYLTNPTETVCRYFFDIPFLFAVLAFLRRPQKRLLLAAACFCAVALFYEGDTGIHLSIAYYAFLVLIYTLKDTRDKVYAGAKDLRFFAGLLVLPPLGALALLRLTQGPQVFTPQFWQNMVHYVRAYLWNGPYQVWGVLQAKEYWLFGMGLWIIAAYVFTLLYIGSLVYLRKLGREHVFVLVLCIYGLALYHYHVFHTTAANCYRTIIPYVFILCFWVHLWVRGLSAPGRRKFYLAFLGLCVYALWTTHLTLTYPNLFNFSRNPNVDPLVAVKQSKGKLSYFNFLFIQYPDAFKLPVNNLGETFEDWRTEDDFKTDEQLKQYVRREFDFAQDAALVKGLTKPDEPVALFSSFEVKILMQAGRRPFFYIFPLVNSRPMRMRLFEVTHMWTTTELEDTIRQLEEKKPAYVFMERVYLAREVPRSFLYDMPAACLLDNYVRQHYEPYAYGKYLVAMKLRNE